MDDQKVSRQDSIYKMGNKMRGIFASSVFISMFAGQVLASDYVIGRWCDQMIPADTSFNREITIVIADGDALERSRFGDGSTLENRLDEKGGDFFSVRDSPSGDAYRVEPSGNLQLLDNDGIIRVAKRLENTRRAGDCLK